MQSITIAHNTLPTVSSPPGWGRGKKTGIPLKCRLYIWYDGNFPSPTGTSERDWGFNFTSGLRIFVIFVYPICAGRQSTCSQRESPLLSALKFGGLCSACIICTYCECFADPICIALWNKRKCGKTNISCIDSVCIDDFEVCTGRHEILPSGSAMSNLLCDTLLCTSWHRICTDQGIPAIIFVVAE